MTLLEKLDALKRATGDNNSTLAKKSGVPYTTIDGLYKQGYANMKLSTLQALCDYFKVPLDYLAKDDDAEAAPAPADDDDLWTLRESLRDDPNRRMLFSLAKNATAKDVEAAASLIDALRATNPDFYDGDDPA